MVSRRRIELPAEIMRKKIAGIENKGRIWQFLLHLMERRLQQRPAGIAPVIPKTCIMRAFEDHSPMLGFVSSKPIDQLRIGHRIEVQI